MYRRSLDRYVSKYHSDHPVFSCNQCEKAFARSANLEMHFQSLKLTLWHLDPLRASAFVPLSSWIKDKKAVLNVTGTGNDCFKWAVLAGMHPVSRLERSHTDPCRMSTYQDHVSKYDFSSLRFPVAISSIGSFAVKTTCQLMCMELNENDLPTSGNGSSCSR